MDAECARDGMSVRSRACGLVASYSWRPRRRPHAHSSRRPGLGRIASLRAFLRANRTLFSADVLELCGPPTVAGPVQRDVRWVQQGDIWREFVVERMTWTYDRGPREFVRILHLYDDSLEAMELGGYGSR